MFKSSKLPVATVETLEKAVTEAVKKSGSQCEGFNGVVIESCTPLKGGADWRIKGVKYGNAKREDCDAALATATEHLQSEFRLGRGITRSTVS